MPYKLGLLDLNGTLIADVPLMLASSHHLFRRFAPKVPLPPLDDFRSGCAEFGEVEWHYQRGIPRTITGDELNNEWNRYYESNSDTVLLSDGAFQFLSFMRDCGIPLVIVSAAAPSMKRLVKKLGAADFFDRMCFDASDKTSVIHHLLATDRYRGTDPRDIFFISDTAGDVAHGNRAGVATFAYPHGRDPIATLRNARPKRIVHSFRGALNEVRSQVPEYA